MLAALIWLFLRGSYGISWDEPVQVAFGDAVWRYFAAGCDYSKVANFPVANLRFYAPGVDLVVAALFNATGWDAFACRHAVTGLFWVATFWPVCSLGRRLAGSAGAWYAGLALLGMPIFLGHGFINPKDLPLACVLAWLVWVCAWASYARTLGWRHALYMGIAFGMVLAVRPGAWFFVILLGLPTASLFWRSRWPLTEMARRKACRTAILATVALLVAWIIMVAPWPYAHRNPIVHPFEAFKYASQFDQIYPVLFRGRVWPSNKLPWDYYFVYLAISSPVPILLFAMAGHIFAVRRGWRQAKGLPVLAGCLFLIWFPLLYFVVRRPNVYDGLRHFLFILPPLAVMAGTGATWCSGWLPARLGPRVRYGVPALLMMTGMSAMVSLHPYQYAYYNFLAGNPATLHERFETDYWVTSYREAAAWVNAHATGPGLTNVLLAANDFSRPAFEHFAAPGLKVDAILGDFARLKSLEKYDYYVATVRYGQWRNFPEAPIVYRIQRDGILLCLIRKRP